jgi:hypothetical protein
VRGAGGSGGGQVLVSSLAVSLSPAAESPSIGCAFVEHSGAAAKTSLAATQTAPRVARDNNNNRALLVLFMAIVDFFFVE